VINWSHSAASSTPLEGKDGKAAHKLGRWSVSVLLLIPTASWMAVILMHLT